MQKKKKETQKQFVEQAQVHHLVFSFRILKHKYNIFLGICLRLIFISSIVFVMLLSFRGWHQPPLPLKCPFSANISQKDSLLCVESETAKGPANYDRTIYPLCISN